MPYRVDAGQAHVAPRAWAQIVTVSATFHLPGDSRIPLVHFICLQHHWRGALRAALRTLLYIASYVTGKYLPDVCEHENVAFFLPHNVLALSQRKSACHVKYTVNV